MEIICIDADKPEPQHIAQATRVLKAGLPLAFPTDTVYGLGVMAAQGSSPQALFELKGRDGDKAIPLLVADADALTLYGREVPAYAFELAARHWPGALTLIVRASDAVPKAFRAADKSVALRSPACPLTLALIEAAGAPLTTTSANLQGGEPATSLATLDPRLAARLTLAVDGGPTPGTIPSTIISCLGQSPILIRAGASDVALSFCA